MNHTVQVTMENSTAALLRVTGMLRRRGVTLTGLNMVVDDLIPAFRLTIQIESGEPLDLLCRQLLRFICVYTVSEQTGDEAEKKAEAPTALQVPQSAYASAPAG